MPPLELEVKEFLDRRKHPFYLHGEAAQFLALRGGVPMGRILVSDDSRYNQQQSANVGCFGMFECPDDPEMARALLDAAAGWLKARGRTGIMGPIDYSIELHLRPAGRRLRHAAADHEQPQPPVLRPPVGSWGLRKAKDFYGWWFVDPRNMVERWRRDTRSG